jgi:hypothetical protein
MSTPGPAQSFLIELSARFHSPEGEKETLIRRPSVKRKNESFSVPKEPTVLVGLASHDLWISAPVTSFRGVGPLRVRTRHSSGSRRRGSLGLPLSPCPSPDGPRKPSVDRARVQLWEPGGSNRPAGLASTPPILLRAHGSGGFPQGSRIVSHSGCGSLSSIPFSGLTIPSPFCSAKQAGGAIR